jgi:hypothetical protein
VRALLLCLACAAPAAVPGRALAAGAAHPSAPPTAAFALAGPALDAVVAAPAGAAQDADSLQALLTGHGVRGRLLYPPGVAVAHVTRAAAARLRAAGFAVLRAGAPPPPDATPQLLRALRLVTALADGAEAPSPSLPDVAPDALGGGSDLRQPQPSLPASEATPAASGAASPLPAAAPLLGQLPTAAELGAFADGSVAVSVIFPQSTGVSSTEDWSRADTMNGIGDRRAYLLGQVDLALAWWATYKPSSSPGFTSRLTFVIPPAGTVGAPQTVPVPGYEPVAQDSSNDLRWRGKIMSSLGFSGTELPETAYGDAVRRANGTDWSFTLYCVDSLRDADGEFPDGLFAYTYDLFGPYMVLTYDNDHYGPQYFAMVMAHEMGHVFGALDEYYMPPSSGYPSGSDLSSGYLWVRNANAEDSSGWAPHPCIMRAGDVGIRAYLDHDLCPSSRGQVGWRDVDHDGIPNVIDTSPSFTLPQQSVSDEGMLSASGTVRENPWPRGGTPPLQAFRHDISIYVPHDVQHRLDGGPWQPATATDGSFDEPVEGLALSAGPLAPGHHLLELQATTGTSASLTRDVWSGPTPVDLHLSGDRATVTYGSSALLTLRTVASDGSGTYPVPLLPGITLSKIGGRSWLLTTGGDGVATRKVGPLYNSRYVATFPGTTIGTQEFTGPASSQVVRVGVRVAVRARRGLSPVRLGRTLRVWGTVRPMKRGAVVLLQETRNGGATWRTVARGRLDSSSRYSLRYRATHRGRIRLRVRYAGDAKNLAGTGAVTRFKVV